jgi:hypothetical protein
MRKSISVIAATIGAGTFPEQTPVEADPSLCFFSFVLAAWRSTPPFRNRLLHPSRRSSSSSATPNSQPLECQDCFFEMFAFCAQIREHFADVHVCSLAFHP